MASNTNQGMYKPFIKNYKDTVPILYLITFSKKTHKISLLQVRLPPEVNRILYIRNLPYKITAEEMYDIFGKYGAIRQIRIFLMPRMHVSTSLASMSAAGIWWSSTTK
ncbi:hypothetical protein HAZT_HAZT005505 [Hyalella azteca]|uniref:RRM domain-containing protein n=1 Tax=Hyalella azteca TaxID=294128 RepID=A0A6A0H1A1_HYAAZ|nr:hypothetical protein HAZT_HAZT005505 [Hyalella azteca]